MTADAGVVPEIWPNDVEAERFMAILDVRTTGERFHAHGTCHIPGSIHLEVRARVGEREEFAP